MLHLIKNNSEQNNYYYLYLYDIDLLIIYNTGSLKLTSGHYLLYYEKIGSYHTLNNITVKIQL